MSIPLTSTQKAVRWHPPSYDIRVEDVPIPQIQHPDDALVKVKFAGLCGSDLHVYRGHAGVDKVHISGHEFIGEVVALGSSYGPHSKGRAPLYTTLKIGDKVVSPFTSNCGECPVCRLGYTARCPNGKLFGSPTLEGGQAQFILVPYGGATLFNLSDPNIWPNRTPTTALEDSSLLMLADILPTGVFAALQSLSHPKVQTVLTGKPWPACLLPSTTPMADSMTMTQDDKVLTVAVVGLGPVGVCTVVSLLDMLGARGQPYRVVAIDLLESRRQKMRAVHDKIDVQGKGLGEFVVCAPDEAKVVVKAWTQGIGCTAVIEVVGHNDALELAHELVRAFGVITSVGVHGQPQLPFTGREMYNGNVSLDFGRCPVRAMFPMAFELLIKRQDVFGGVGQPASLIDNITDFKQAAECYRAFEKGEVGKIIFDPWM
ncbi:hypothetical protein AMATHDRAFT_136465 [Amanita thiersii Skay4041]|uniref:Alcohol dehydrogenase-like N-terminal domain-containing protein n=1 Tax=Amanita thiersii Skay4041 TaxID=703135 RepID=A0A2A9NUV4_9AGAR|nr:hypothetical protein AMATHDRAFT_136465 [Amanita thiersii Skay4041]